MLRVTIEIVPFGNEAQKRTIEVIHIANDGTGSNLVSNYDVTTMHESGGQQQFRADKITRDSNIVLFLKAVFSTMKEKK